MNIIKIIIITIFALESHSELAELVSRCSKLRYTPDKFSPFP